MNLNKTLFGSHNLGNYEKFFMNAKKVIIGAVLLMVIGLLSGNAVYAQRSACEQYGFSNSRTNLEGIWKLTFTSGLTRHETFMAIKNQRGASITRYYDSNLRRTRRISQQHVVCQSKRGIVILGFNPTDIDSGQKGSSLTYSADNFFFSVETDGSITAFNLDDNRNLVEIDIEYLEELPNDIR